MLRSLNGVAIEGYEIHMGVTENLGGCQELVRLEDGRVDALANEDGSVMGSYLHGIFDTDGFAEEMIRRLMKEKGFIETSTSHEDKRMKIVRLTGKEDKFVKDVISEREEMEKQLVKGLTQKDQENLRWYLKKMYENLTEAS